MVKIDSLIPELWKTAGDIKAAVSLRNPHYNPDGTIPGLNLGMVSPDMEDEVQDNREMWLQQLGGSAEQLATARQIHSNTIQIVSQPGVYPDTDGLITQKPGLWVGVQVADCAPVLLADRKNRIVAAVHAGWRGAVSGIVPKSIDQMCRIGADPKQLEAFVGPCIGQSNFEVGREVASRFPEDLVDDLNYNKPHPDLKQLIKRQLIQSSVPDNAIEISPLCTMEEEELLFSHRLQKGNTGRMMGVICLS